MQLKRRKAFKNRTEEGDSFRSPAALLSRRFVWGKTAASKGGNDSRAFLLVSIFPVDLSPFFSFRGVCKEEKSEADRG